MNAMDARVKRRSIMRGISWAAPAATLAVAAPAIAASPFTCPPMPVGFPSWTRTVIGGVNTATDRWEGSTLLLITDSQRTSGTSNVTFETTIDVTQGHSYIVRLAVQTAKGYNGSCTTVPTQFSASAVQGLAVTPLANLTTATGNQGGRTSVVPPVDCSNNNGVSRFGSGGVVGASTTLNTVVTATATGALTLRMVLSLPATTGGNNDDWRITPSFVSCSR